MTGAEDALTENILASLSDEEVGKRLAGAKLAMRNAEEYIRELKAELLTRLGRGEVLYVPAPEVRVGKEMVQPIASVTIRHKSRSSLKYNERAVIAALKETLANPFADGLVYTEDPQERLDRAAFEDGVFRDEYLKPLRSLVTHGESDWIEVGGLPK